MKHQGDNFLFQQTVRIFAFVLHSILRFKPYQHRIYDIHITTESNLENEALRFLRGNSSNISDYETLDFNSTVDSPQVIQQVKNEIELDLHTMGIHPEDIYGDSPEIDERQVHNIVITPLLTPTGHLGEYEVEYEAVVTDVFGNVVEANHEIVTEDTRDGTSTFLILQPLNHLFENVVPFLRLNIDDTHNRESSSFNELNFRIHLTQESDTDRITLHVSHSIGDTILLEEEEEEEVAEDIGASTYRNSFAGLFDDSDSEDESEEEGSDDEDGEDYHESPPKTLPRSLDEEEGYGTALTGEG